MSYLLIGRLVYEITVIHIILYLCEVIDQHQQYSEDKYRRIFEELEIIPVDRITSV